MICWKNCILFWNILNLSQIEHVALAYMCTYTRVTVADMVLLNTPFFLLCSHLSFSGMSLSFSVVTHLATLRGCMNLFLGLLIIGVRLSRDDITFDSLGRADAGS